MSTMKHPAQEDALDGWLSDLNGGETSMRKLRKKLAAKAEARTAETGPTRTGTPTHTATGHSTPGADEDECPTCHGSGIGHTGSNILRAIS